MNGWQLPLTVTLVSLSVVGWVPRLAGQQTAPPVGQQAVPPVGQKAVPSDGHEAPSAGKDVPLRSFRLDYGATLDGLPAGKRVQVWLPVPPSNEDQQVRTLDERLPADFRIEREPKYGNLVLYFEALAPDSGRLAFQRTYRVRRREVRGLPGSGETTQKKLTPQQQELFLTANALVPVDGKPLELIQGLQLPTEPLELGRLLYDRVERHMRYDKSRPGYGTGDAVWACDSRYGNCTDFHSLFISLARSQKMPARFEIGFPLPEQRGKGEIGGYHCWGMFHVDGHGWVPVDISEADKNPARKEYFFGNLTEDRVAFSQGRDLVLVPRQAGPPLNFFVYPYVEVDGKPWPRERMTLAFAFEDERS